MEKKILLIFIILISIKPFKSLAQANIQDSLALVDYYDSTYGVSPWQFGQSWDLEKPVSTWIGVGMDSYGRVISIQLTGGGHRGHIPSSFGNLTALESIDYLDFMMDATLPESFSKLVNLRSLRMHAVFNMTPFPVVLTKLTNLTLLDFEDNLFTDSLPSSIGNMTRLISLDVSNSFMHGSRIPPQLGNLKNLNSLIMYNNRFYGAIPTSLANIDSLSALDLSSNNLSGNIPRLSTLKNLNYLSLNDNQFTFQDFEPFVQAVNERIEKIEYFNLNPQGLLKINQQDEKLSISAGGTLSNNTFKWYKTGLGLVATFTGDSTYTANTNGEYFVEVTNSIAAGVTLSSDTINCNYILPDTTITVIHKIVNADITYVNAGMIRMAAIQTVKDSNALQGDVKITVTFSPSFPTLDFPAFVNRHYDITPVENAANAKAIVTLYYTQDDFDKFNEIVTDNNLGLALMPTGGINNGHIIVDQFHGTYDSNTYRYTGSTVQIIPNVVWNPVNNWWEISFPVSGFSGFYLTSVNSALPLTLLNFNCKKEMNSAVLEWQTSGEVNTKQFIVQADNGGGFSNIGTVSARSLKGINNYTFTDENPKDGNNFYRLMMEDMDNRVTYSNVLNINFSVHGTTLKAYPNPSSSILNVKISAANAGNVRLKITNALGQTVYQKIFSVNAGDNLHALNIDKMPAGNYYLNIFQDDKSQRIGFVKE